MNEKTQIEIERKYIIEKPDFSIIRNMAKSTESEILQIYLPSEMGETRRIRRRAYRDKTICYETRKIRIDGMSCTEIEREITEAEFSALSQSIKEGTSPINKTRFTFDYEGQTIEIDVYPQWQSSAIMETELESREKQVEIPSFISIIREVTGDKAYSNASMSREFPKEDI